MCVCYACVFFFKKSYENITILFKERKKKKMKKKKKKKREGQNNGLMGEKERIKKEFSLINKPHNF